MSESLSDATPFLVQVITGSRMATVWANIAVAPVNGFSLLSHMATFRLPATVDPALLDIVWDKLNAERAEADAALGVGRPLLDPLLRIYAPSNHASLAYFCEEWDLARYPEATAFSKQLYQTKIYPEVGVPGSERMRSISRCDLPTYRPDKAMPDAISGKLMWMICFPRLIFNSTRQCEGSVAMTSAPESIEKAAASRFALTD